MAQDSEEGDDGGCEDDDLFNPDEFPDDDRLCRQYGSTDEEERGVATAPF